LQRGSTRRGWCCATFNISNLFLFDVGDNSWMNYFKEKGDDMIKITPKDPLQVPTGLIARSKAKKLKYAFNGFIRSIWAKMNFKKSLASISDDQALVNLIYVQERLDPSITYA